jgi:hypothetical protein
MARQEKTTAKIGTAISASRRASEPSPADRSDDTLSRRETEQAVANLV